MPDPCKNNAFDGSEQGDSGGFSANQSKPWRHGEHSYYFEIDIGTAYKMMHNHTCEPPDGRMNSPVFFRSSPDLKYPPGFSWLLHIPPVFSWFLHVHVPHVQFAPCAFRPRKQGANCGILNPLHSAEVLYSHFKFFLTTLYTHPGLIISHLVDDYLNIC